MSRKVADNLAKTAEIRAAEEEAYRNLHGKHLDDVQYLQRKHFVVNKVRGGDYLVGNKRLSGDELAAMAARERRLEGEGRAFGVRKVAQTATGLRIGESVPIERDAAVAPERPARVQPAPKAAAAPAAPRTLTGAAAAARSRAAEHSTDLGGRPRVVWLDLALLQVDHRYQREIAGAGQAHVNRLLRSFNWNCYQPIIVSERADGTYAVIDGQHRLEAARKHPLVSELPCYIVDAPTVAAQAAIFSTVNGRRLGLTSLQKFWASHAAGEASAVTVHEICQAHGVVIMRGVPSYDIPPKSVLAPFTLQKMLARVGRDAVDSAIRLLATTQGGKPNAFRSPTLVALATIAAAKDFSRDRWTRVLGGLDLDKVYDEARTGRVTGGGTLETATERVLRQHAAGAARRAA